MIIVEGFDGSGKSHLARRAGERLGWPVATIGGPTRDEPDVLSWLLHGLVRMKERCIQDRITHISESVYSALSHPRKASLAIYSLKELAFSRGVIYCRPPTPFLLEEMQAHVKKEWDTDEHLLGLVSNAGTLIKLYDTIIDVAALYTIVHRYDRTRAGDDERILNIIEEMAR